MNFNISLIKFILLFLGSCFIMFQSEHFVTHSIESKNNQNATAPIFELDEVYKRIITAGYREPVPNYTVIIDIGQGLHTTPRLAVCGENSQRRFMANLLNSIAYEKPAVIVIDKVFMTDCGSDKGTDFLIKKVQEISSQIPIIIGKEIDQKASKHFKHTSNKLPNLIHTLDFRSSESQNITDGIVNSDPDNRKLVLKWHINNEESYWVPKEYLSLSWSAVQAYYKNQHKNNKYLQNLENMADNYIRPYISFINASEFQIIQADDLVLYKYSTKNDREIKTLLPNHPELRGKIVIIGETKSESDIHSSPIGQVSGLFLEANYIEALLDQRYYKPIPTADYIIGFLIFSAVYFCGLYIHSPLKLFILLTSILAVCYSAIYIIVALFGWYINPITINLLAIVILVFHRIFPKAVESSNHG